MSRYPDVEAFLTSVRRGYEVSDMDPDTRRCVHAVFAALEAGNGERNEGGRRFPACEYLDAATRLVEGTRPEFEAIMASFTALEPLIDWTRRPGGTNASANIMEGHANAMVVGPGGLETRDDVQVGICLLAPNVRYPDHCHKPEETYLCLTPGAFRHGDDGDWFSPGVGGSFYNHPDMLHAMRSGEQPLLAVWCLRRVG